MKIGILGTGMVGQTLGSALVESGHAVMLGARDADNPKASHWVKNTGQAAKNDTFNKAAEFGEILFNCTAGIHSLQAFKLVDTSHLAAKIVVDVANPLSFQNGGPVQVLFANDASLGEQIQEAYPEARVVKALNTMNCGIMVAPHKIDGPHHLFMAGNDDAAKAEVRGLLHESFGWPHAAFIDLGDIGAARGTEQLMHFWLRMMQTAGHVNFNYYMNGAS